MTAAMAYTCKSGGYEIEMRTELGVFPNGSDSACGGRDVKIVQVRIRFREMVEAWRSINITRPVIEASPTRSAVKEENTKHVNDESRHAHGATIQRADVELQ
jgi:hypothetical protein